MAQRSKFGAVQGERINHTFGDVSGRQSPEQAQLNVTDPWGLQRGSAAKERGIEQGDAYTAQQEAEGQYQGALGGLRRAQDLAANAQFRFGTPQMSGALELYHENPGPMTNMLIAGRTHAPGRAFPESGAGASNIANDPSSAFNTDPDIPGNADRFRTPGMNQANVLGGLRSYGRSLFSNS